MECRICDKELTQEDSDSISMYDNTITCNEHREYAPVSQPWLIRKELGIKYKYPNCILCKAELTVLELNSIEKMDSLATCTKHKNGKDYLLADAYVLPEKVDKIIYSMCSKDRDKDMYWFNRNLCAIINFVNENKGNEVSISEIIKIGGNIFTVDNLISLFSDSQLFCKHGFSYKKLIGEEQYTHINIY